MLECEVELSDSMAIELSQWGFQQKGFAYLLGLVSDYNLECRQYKRASFELPVVESVFSYIIHL